VIRIETPRAFSVSHSYRQLLEHHRDKPLSEDDIQAARALLSGGTDRTVASEGPSNDDHAV
jgi:hypothetical protein